MWVLSLEELIGHYSDLHKDVYFHRPRWMPSIAEREAMSKEELKSLYRLIEDKIEWLRGSEQREKEYREKCAKETEEELEIFLNMAGDRESAIRWYLQACQVEDMDSWIYQNNIEGTYLEEELTRVWEERSEEMGSLQ